MDASDLIRALPKITLRGGGRPHMEKAVIGMAADINNNALLRELRRPWIIN
jgi:hypothetical protein